MIIVCLPRLEEEGVVVGADGAAAGEEREGGHEARPGERLLEGREDGGAKDNGHKVEHEGPEREVREPGHNVLDHAVAGVLERVAPVEDRQGEHHRDHDEVQGTRELGGFGLNVDPAREDPEDHEAEDGARNGVGDDG